MSPSLLHTGRQETLTLANTEKRYFAKDAEPTEMR